MSPAEMPAGRELDALVAEKVMGWIGVVPEHVGADGSRWFVWSGQPTLPSRRIEVPRYSTDIAAALDALAETGGIATLRRVKANEWHVRLDSVSPHGWWAETLPLAICRALLAAVSAAAPSDELAAVREAETECHAEDDHGR